jgi:uncharacterized membrane protein YdjX (TVP38/TMEM64 family)
MDTLKENQRTRSIRIIVVSILAMILIAVIATKDMDGIKTFITRSGYWGLPIVVAIYGVMGATVIPSEPLTVIISTLFNPLLATIVAGLGNTLAAVIEYYLGSKLSDAASFDEKRHQLPLGLGKLPVESPVFLMAGRMIPGYGPKLVSVVAGMYKVPITRYIWTTAIPTFIGAALFAYGGYGLISLFIH